MTTPGFSRSLGSGGRPDCIQVSTVGWLTLLTELGASQVCEFQCLGLPPCCCILPRVSESLPGTQGTVANTKGPSLPLPLPSIRTFSKYSCLFPTLLPQCSLTKMINSRPQTLTAKSAKTLKTLLHTSPQQACHSFWTQ